MGFVTFIYGFIQEGWTGFGEDAELRNRIIRKNTKRVLAGLPTEVNWPPLSKQMFSVSNGPITMAYRCRLIHFAAATKELDFDLKDWIEKFEELLRKLHWEKAVADYHGIFIGEHKFTWTPPDEWVTSMRRGKLGPVDSWNFTSTLPIEQLNTFTSRGNLNCQHTVPYLWAKRQKPLMSTYDFRDWLY